ncbi:MAG: alpha/beta hydrolase family esterase [Microthrixaceae bacterium]
MPRASRALQRRTSVIVAFVALAIIVSSCGLFNSGLSVENADVKTIEVDGQDDREAVLVAPEGHFFNSDRQGEAGDLPLVVALHGLGGDAVSFGKDTEWPTAARDNGFVVAFPQGVDDSWNAGRCCGAAVAEGTNDVAFIDALINQLVAEEGVDPDQVYLTGYSNGAMFTYLYACLAAGDIAGAASVAGTNFSDCEPNGSIDFLQTSGADDPVIPVLGGESELVGVPEVPSVEQSLLDMAEAAGCQGLQTLDVNGVMSFQSTECNADTSVRFDVIEGFGHEYPTAENSPNYVAVDKILEFWGLGA